MCVVFCCRDILECRNCGIIYRSRQYWYGNPDVENVVQEEVAHVWPEVSLKTFLKDTRFNRDTSLLWLSF